MNKAHIEVFSIGTVVDLGEKLKGTVIEILISGNQCVKYKCSWWDGKTRKSEWFYAREIDGPYEERIQFGFK